MNPDFAEILSALSAAGADYLVVGGFAVAAHGNPRAAGRPKDLADLVWIERELGRSPRGS